MRRLSEILLGSGCSARILLGSCSDLGRISVPNGISTKNPRISQRRYKIRLLSGAPRFHFPASSQRLLPLAAPGNHYPFPSPPFREPGGSAASIAMERPIPPLGISPLGISPLGISALGIPPWGISPLGISPLGIPPLGMDFNEI